jgi:PhzF family phenazine biosynthesis protein
MTIKLYQVDAFTDKVFGGNPAAVCPLDSWPDDRMMQQIALENNLSETAFFVPEGTGYRIRWFTPTVEVDLCGHATLATAHVLWNHLDHPADEIKFQSRSGLLTVRREEDLITLDFPADRIEKVEAPAALLQAFSHRPAECYRGKSDYLAVFDREEVVRLLAPDFFLLSKVSARGVIVTSPGSRHDFVSRFFGPQSGVNEDPVTGSAHTTLAVYWAGRLGRNEFSAAQVSARGGLLAVKLEGERVLISGRAVTYLEGQIIL